MTDLYLVIGLVICAGVPWLMVAHLDWRTRRR